MAASGKAVILAALRTELLFVRGPKGAVGMGAAARVGLRRLLARRPIPAAALVGFCGGLAEDLPPGAVLLAQRIEGPDGTVPVGGEALAKARELLPQARVGSLFTHPELLSKKAIRKRLKEEGVAPAPLGVDMESSVVAAELLRRKIPFLVARIVLDAWAEEVSLGLERFLWAPRALRCAWKLGRVAEALRQALEEEDG